MRKIKSKLFDLVLRKRLNKLGPVRPISELKREQVNRILVVSSTALGDTVLSLPAIRSTRSIFPGAEITWLLKKSYLELFRVVECVDDFIPYHGGYRKLKSLYQRVSSKSFDLCLIFHDSDPCPGGVAYLAGVPFILRSGLRDDQLAPYLSGRVTYVDDHHAIEQRLDVLRTIVGGGASFVNNLYLEVKVESQKEWSSRLHEFCEESGTKKYIGFQTLAAKKYCVWPKEKFIALGKRLIRQCSDVVLVLLGARGEKRYCQDIADGIASKKRVINLAGKYKVSELPAILKNFDLLVTNDTGPLHVAVAVGTPTVSLFVPSRIEHTGPNQDLHKHKVIRKVPPCNPCVRKYCDSPWCMNLISVDEVFDVINSGFHRCW